MAAPETDSPPSRVGLVAAVAVVVALAALWAYAFIAGRDADAPGTLDDDRLGPRAEAICLPATREVDALPAASAAENPERRSPTVRTATDVLEAMVERLRVIRPEGERDRVLWDQWLDDWDDYLEARDEHAKRLARGEDSPFTVPAVGGQPVTLRMDAFTRINDMRSCATPGDV